MEATRRERIRKWANRGVNVLWGLAVAALGYVAAQVLLIATFRIPSDSMAPTLLRGDTLYIADGIYQIGDTGLPVGNVESQKSIMRFEPAHIPAKQYYTLPFDSLLGWNIRDFGPMYIPAKGDSIPMNRIHYLLYRKLIEWEQHDGLTWHDGGAWLRGRRMAGYRFEHNYYFMGGDNCMNSVDSRYWGLIPEEFMVGRAALILKSTDPRSGKLRLNRLCKQIE